MAELQRKRCREEEEGEGEEGMGKRFRGLTPEAEELIHMLEEAEEERNVAQEDALSGVMKSLEEEISSCCSSENGKNVEEGCSEEQMSFLLTASDDELGIPPSPSLIESPLYEPPPEIASHVDGWWHFEEYNPNWAAEYIYDEYEERDFHYCGGLFEFSEGEHLQETTSAI